MKASKPKKAIAQKKTVVAVSGGFDPLHVGHIRMLKEAKALGDILVVIVNNDNWMKAKKGYSFMPEKQRKELLESIRYVDRVILTKHKKNTEDMSVVKELLELKPDIFANGGDRKLDNIPEVAACQKIGTKMVFNIGAGGKVESSSWLLAKFMEYQLDQFRHASAQARKTPKKY